MRKNTTVLVFMFFVSLTYSQIKSKSITEFSQQEFNNIILLDVRTPEEFEAGHLPKAFNINWFNPDFISLVENKASKDETIYVYCKSGGRSIKAVTKLSAIGYTVINLEGGYEAYKKALNK
jgi:rhodanese-related sulfurtransferase